MGSSGRSACAVSSEACLPMHRRTAAWRRELRDRQETLAIMSELSSDFSSARWSRAAERPVRAGLIGCGAFGAGILAQAASVPLLEIPAVADRSLDTARRAYARAGV